MNRIKVVAGNWKMNKTAAEARELVNAMSAGLRAVENVERVLCPPFTSIALLSEMLADSGIGVGAQNLHWEEKGAYTGEIAPNVEALVGLGSEDGLRPLARDPEGAGGQRADPEGQLETDLVGLEANHHAGVALPGLASKGGRDL